MTRYAPILQEVAARLAGLPASRLRADPTAWAYALRDAAALAEPDVVVSHLDAELEADALALAGGEEAAAAAVADGATAPPGWSDPLALAPPLAETAPASAAVELVGILAGVFRTGPTVAATLTGPGALARRLAPRLLGRAAGPEELAEAAELAGDAAAGLAGAYAEAGADLLLVVEDAPEGLATEDLERAHEPIVRALEHRRVEAVLVGAEAGSALGYGSVAERWGGTGPCSSVALLPSEVWMREPTELAALLSAPGARLVLSDGPVPGDAPPESLRAARAALRGVGVR